MQLSVLGHVRLYEQPRNTRIRPSSEPVDEYIVDLRRQLRGVVVASGEHVPIGNKEEALVLVLQSHPVLQCTVVIAQMQSACRAHARKHAPSGSGGAQLIPRMA